MNSALAKLQYLSNKSEFEFVFAGDNGNPPYQDSNRLRFCNLVAPKPKSVHNLPFWPTEAYQAHRSPLAYCHWAACTIMPIGESAKKATVQRTFPDTSWARSAKDFWYWSHFIPLPLTQPLCHLPPTPWVLILIHTPLLSVKNLHILHPSSKTQISFNPSSMEA